MADEKVVCTCTKCGNEAEMTVTCSLECSEDEKKQHPNQVKKGATCSVCGSEADIWLDQE